MTFRFAAISAKLLARFLQHDQPRTSGGCYARFFAVAQLPSWAVRRD